MSYHSVEQGSSAWHQLRLGCLTGSRLKDALSVLKNGQPSQRRSDYTIELIAERLTGAVAEHFVTREMQFGSDNESGAVAAYESRMGIDTDKCGIFQHDLLPKLLASPDRLVGDDGLLECKVPKASTHIAWMMADVVPEEHLLQLIAELACSGRAWVDFVSWRPDLSARYAFFRKRLEANNEQIALVLASCENFLTEVDAMHAELAKRFPEVEE